MQIVVINLCICFFHFVFFHFLNFSHQRFGSVPSQSLPAPSPAGPFGSGAVSVIGFKAVPVPFGSGRGQVRFRFWFVVVRDQVGSVLTVLILFDGYKCQTESDGDFETIVTGWGAAVAPIL